ncbi:hypothetical protein M0R19_06330 [Candidatus Pacearchaeota archaeon]|jgi:hypothetical protein|nr:hypothetical protein [Candidatus Pacearchaeota archaeon]
MLLTACYTLKLPSPDDFIVTEEEYRDSVAKDILAGKDIVNPTIKPGTEIGTTVMLDEDAASLYTDAKMYQLQSDKISDVMKNKSFPTFWQEIKRLGTSFLLGVLVGAGLSLYLTK